MVGISYKTLASSIVGPKGVTRVAGRNPHRIWVVAVASTILVGLSGCASRSAVDAPYVGSEWRLTMVTNGSESVPISVDLDATMDLLDDGSIIMDDSVNVLSGHFTTTADGFEVTGVATTLVGSVGSVGDDPQRGAAVEAMRALAFDTSDGGLTLHDDSWNTVISSDDRHLVVDADSLRLEFDRAGRA
jgi:hypothetical protein